MCYTTLPLGNSSKVHSFSFFFFYPAQLLPQASTSNHLAPSMPIAQGSKESGYSSVDSTSTRLSLPPSLSLSLSISYVCTYPSGRPNFKLHKLQGTLHIYIVQSSSNVVTPCRSFIEKKGLRASERRTDKSSSTNAFSYEHPAVPPINLSSALSIPSFSLLTYVFLTSLSADPTYNLA